MDKFSYKTISTACEAKWTEKNSRFLSFAFPINTEEQAQLHLEKIAEQHPKANHHCYAYRIGISKNNFRANDDGEPSGSAGRPILGQIDSFELTNVLVVVTRYFGGVKLGVSGLIKAYKTSAKLVLEEAKIIKKEIQSSCSIFIPYEQVNDFLEWANNSSVNIVNQNYTNTGGNFDLKFSKRQEKQMKKQLQVFID